jgi:hypothetical protein
MNGYLEKRGSGFMRSWQRRFFRMDNFTLFYFESEEDQSEPKDAIDLRRTLSVGRGEKEAAAKQPAAADSTCARVILLCLCWGWLCIRFAL